MSCNFQFINTHTQTHTHIYSIIELLYVRQKKKKSNYYIAFIMSFHFVYKITKD